MTKEKEDARSILELFAAALDWTVEDGFGDWSAVSALQRNGSREVLDRALALLQSDDPRIRARGVDVLGQLGSPERTFPEECLEAALGLLAEDAEPVVIKSAVLALNHLDSPRGIPALLAHKDHPDPDMRWAVAFALGGRSEPAAVAALIELSEDSEALVRDWATFGLGQIGGADGPEVREALVRRLDDVDEVTRFEAIRGLARRGDPRAVGPLIKALSAAPGDCSLWEPARSLLGAGYDHEDMAADDLLSGLKALSRLSGLQI